MSKCFNINKKAQINLLLVHAQEIYQLGTFSKSLYTTQSFINDCPNSSNSGEPFFICQMQGWGHQAVASYHEKRVYSDLHVHIIRNLHI